MGTSSSKCQGHKSKTQYNLSRSILEEHELGRHSSCPMGEQGKVVDPSILKKYKSQISKNEMEYSKMTNQLENFDPVVQAAHSATAARHPGVRQQEDYS